MKVRVIYYEGNKAEETPRAFLLGEHRDDAVRILDRWRGEDHEYVKLDGSDGARYILRYDRSREVGGPDDGISAAHDGKVTLHFLR